MNTTSPMHARALPQAALRIVLPATVVLLIASSLPMFGATDANGTKTHTLFMGVDLAVERGSTFRKVRDVHAGAFILQVNGQPVSVPTRSDNLKLKIEHSLKLAEGEATLLDLKGDRAYTPSNDPTRKFMRSASMAMAADAQNDVGQKGVTVANDSLAFAYLTGDAGIIAAAEDRLATSVDNLITDELASRSSINNPGTHAMTLSEELAQEMFDAMAISFSISSPVPLEKPYVVIITRFREKDSKPGTAREWIYARALDAIESGPQFVQALQGGFPPGFILEKYHVHLFNEGREIATNVSPKRVELTAEEAFEYVKLQYVAAHKGATLPPTPAIARLPADMHSRLSGGQFNRTYYVKVGEDGTAGEAFLDADCSQKLDDPYVASLVQKIRFKPALENGKPVAGLAPLRLNKLSL